MSQPSRPTRWLVVFAMGLASIAVACAPGGDLDGPTLGEAKAMLRVMRQAGEVSKLIASESALLKGDGDAPLTPDERTRLVSLFATLVDHDLAFISFEERYLFHWREVKDVAGRDRALVVGMAAHTARMRTALALLVRSAGKDRVRATLNEASPEFGLGPGHYDRILLATATPQALLTLEIGLDILDRHVAAMRKKGLADDAHFLELYDTSSIAITSVIDLYHKSGAVVALAAIKVAASNVINGLVQPLVTDIALWFGDTRIRNEGKSLISRAQLDLLAANLRPGDIALERRNWYLSNLGLPGFWPHAELYVGTPDELTATFDADPDVLAAFPGGLAPHLAKTWPDAWKRYTEAAHDGLPMRVMESVSEGAKFSTLYEAMGADYIGVLRPRLSPVEKARAISRAFGHFGKAYDFDFDFQTESVLVCSELVWRAYQSPASEGRSLVVDLSVVLGRSTLPPNDIAGQFDRKHGTDTEQFDFVAFLDGREAQGIAIEATEADFRNSWTRPKWDIYQP